MGEDRTPQRLQKEALSIDQMLDAAMHDYEDGGPLPIQHRIARLERWVSSLLRARAHDLREEAKRIQ